MTYLLFIIGLLMYAVFEGVTEAMMWDELEKETRREIDYAAKYHLFRLFETLGIIFMGISLYQMQPNIQQGLLLGIGSLLFAILPFRLAFIKIRKQDELLPQDWYYWIWLPIFGEFAIRYPKSIWLIIAAAIGIMLIVAGIG